MNKIRVLLADDHVLIRTGIRALLEKFPELQVVNEASDGSETLRLIRQHQPDVALIKSATSRSISFDTVTRIRKECPEVHVIVLSMNDDEDSLTHALASGAAGYLTMSATVAELGLAIKTVSTGKTHISSSAKKLLASIVRSKGGGETLDGLTPRQREVLKLIAEGNTTKQIALKLNISAKTVETHRMLLSERLDIRNTAGLVSFAIKTGLIGLED